MNFLKKGPELKLSELKVPPFLGDLYYDLRERHLLPLVALLAVAIVVVPVVMGSSGSDDEPELAAVATPSAAPPGSGSLVVAKATPGLRDYRKRLHGDGAKDPFEQQYAEEGGNAGSSPTATPAAPGIAPGGEPDPGGGGSSPGDGGGGGGGTAPKPGELTYYSYAIDVRVVSAGPRAGTSSATGLEGAAATSGEGGDAPPAQGASASAKGKATVRRNLPQLTMLPSREAPAAIYMGVTKDRKKALLMVSSDVRAIFGDGICVIGSQTCQMVAVEPGLPLTFLYGPQERAFEIEVLKIRLVTTDELNRAPLGKPKKGD